jgi:hypothetical protein
LSAWTIVNLPIVLIEFQYISPEIRGTEPGEQFEAVSTEILLDFGVGARRHAEIGQFLAGEHEEEIE